MIQFFLTLLILSGVYTKDIWENTPDILTNITIDVNTPLNLPDQKEVVAIKDLNGTLYANWLSQIKSSDVLLRFDNLEKIEDGAVCSSPTIRKFEIWLGTNTGLKLSKETFKNCEHLEELSVIGDFDNPNQIDDDSFNNLSNLKNLNLLQLKLNQVTRKYFTHLKSLEYLTLRKCSIHRIDADALNDLKNLKDLEIYFNSDLRHIPANLFKNTAKLENLKLFSNNITGLTWDEFEGLTSLKALHIGRNAITLFDATKIAKNLPNLESFSFELNPVDCKKREAFAEDLRSKLNHKIDIEHKYDPGFVDSCEEEEII